MPVDVIAATPGAQRTTQPSPLTTTPSVWLRACPRGAPPRTVWTSCRGPPERDRRRRRSCFGGTAAALPARSSPMRCDSGLPLATHRSLLRPARSHAPERPGPVPPDMSAFEPIPASTTRRPVRASASRAGLNSSQLAGRRSFIAVRAPWSRRAGALRGSPTAPGRSMSSEGTVSRGSASGPESAGFVEEQESRPARLLVVRSGRAGSDCRRARFPCSSPVSPAVRLPPITTPSPNAKARPPSAQRTNVRRRSGSPGRRAGPLHSALASHAGRAGTASPRARARSRATLPATRHHLPLDRRRARRGQDEGNRRSRPEAPVREESVDPTVTPRPVRT
jgi:hypothetical protein